MADLTNLGYNVAHLISSSLTLKPRAGTLEMFTDPLGTGVPIDNWQAINEFLTELMGNPLAHMFSGDISFKMPEGLSFNNEKDIQKIGEKLADHIADQLATTIQERRIAQAFNMFYNETLKMYQAFGSEPDTIIFDKANSGYFGTWFEQILFGIPESQNDPRADILNLKMDVKTTKSGPVSIGGSSFYMDIDKNNFLSKLPDSKSIGKKESLQDINIFVTTLLIAVYKLAVKMRNLMLVSYDEGGVSKGGYQYINFRAIELFTILLIKKVWDAVYQELLVQAGFLDKKEIKKRTLDITFKGAEEFRHGEYAVNLSIGYRGGGGKVIERGVDNRGYREYPWESLYAARIDLLDKMRTSTDVFRKAIFRTIKKETHPWFFVK